MKKETECSSPVLATVLEAGSLLVITLRTPCLADTSTTLAIEREIRSLTARSCSRNILLDCREVQCMSIEFLGVLKDLKAELESKGGNLHCCGIRHEVCLVLKALGLGGLYAGPDLVDALDSCLVSLQQNRKTRPIVKSAAI